MSDYKDMVMKEWSEYENADHYPNIMLLGCTGCGKSSLINLVFGKNVARVNNTDRGTTGFDIYLAKNNQSTVNLIDSRGYEMGSSAGLNEYIQEFKNWMNQNRSTENKVHLVWYCISAGGTRVQDFDTEVIKAIRNDHTLHDKVAVIITQCDKDDDQGSSAAAIRDVIHQDISNDIPVFEVSTDPRLPLDLQKMIDWSIAHLDDEEIRKMFIAAQMVNLNSKRKIAGGIITGAVAAAAATGGIPIPCSDAPILTAEQVAMSASIIKCYGLNMATGFISTIVGETLISNLGKTLVGSILKFIPGVGSVVGGLINGGVAASITAALGIAISEICYASCKKIAKGESLVLEDAFSSEAINIAMKSFLSQNGKKSAKQIEDIVDVYSEEK